MLRLLCRTGHGSRIRLRQSRHYSASQRCTKPESMLDSSPGTALLQTSTCQGSQMTIAPLPMLCKSEQLGRPTSLHGTNRLSAWRRCQSRSLTLPHGCPVRRTAVIKDTRLLFYWKRLPGEQPSSSSLVLETSTWNGVLDSLRSQGGPEDRLAFAGGLTLKFAF
jgi:hypothetical protein